MIQSFETPSPIFAPAFSADCSAECSADRSVARSQSAEGVVQAAYASRGRRPLRALSRLAGMTRSVAARGRAITKIVTKSITKSLAESDGLVETLVTLLATILFGLSWASIEMRSSDAALRARHDALAQTYAETTTSVNATNPANTMTGVSVETSYAAIGAATAPLPFNGALNTQWTDEPHARSKQ